MIPNNSDCKDCPECINGVCWKEFEKMCWKEFKENLWRID
jgi:hypothetical protein